MEIDLEKQKEACSQLRFLGVYCALVFIFSLAFNSILLATFVRHRHLRTSYNVHIMTLVSINLLTTITVLPLITLSNLYCKWLFGRLGCTITAFLIFWSGSVTIYTLAALSHGHYESLKSQIMGRKMPTIRQSCFKVFMCNLIALLWTLMPVFGWSSYSLEGIGTSCSIQWTEKSFNVKSFSITVLITVFVIPLLVIIIYNIKLIRIIKHFERYRALYINMKSLRRRVSIERSLVMVTLALLTGFLITWTPYALVAVYRVIFDDQELDPLVETLPGMFAKSSLLWTSLFYLLINRQVRQKFRDIFRLRSLQSVTSQNNPGIRRVSVAQQQKNNRKQQQLLVESTIAKPLEMPTKNDS